MSTMPHPLECLCNRCTQPLEDHIATMERARQRSARRAKQAERAATEAAARAEQQLRIDRAVEQAAMRYELARGRIGLRTAAKRASQAYSVSEHSVHRRLQQLHGQGKKRGKPRRQEAA